MTEAGTSEANRTARLLFGLPLVVFLVIAAYFWAGLGMNPRIIPSVLIDTPFPQMDLAAIRGRDRGLSTADLKGQVSLVNLFGSWCYACRIEHPFLMKLKQENAVPVHGINWREKDRDAGPEWLREFGDPYTLIGDDPESKAAIALGVTGAPETFIVDKNAVIRYKHIGPITPRDWEETLFPIIRELRAQ